MANRKPATPTIISGDENFNRQIQDDCDSDSDPIRMSTPESREEADAGFPASSCLLPDEASFETNSVEPKKTDLSWESSLGLIEPQLSYEQFKGLEESDKKQHFNSMNRASCNWKAFENSCPRIDNIVLQHYDNNNRLTFDEQNVACSLREDIKRKWSLPNMSSTNPSSGHALRRMSELTRWYDNELQWNSDKLQFEFEPPHDSRSRYPSLDADYERLIRQHGFYYHISSPLLLYRLNIFTGGLNDVITDEYKVSWDMTFHHVDKVSTLRLWDSKGGARAVFGGLKKTQDDALEFINFLTRYKFPHSYDGVISGTVA